MHSIGAIGVSPVSNHRRMRSARPLLLALLMALAPGAFAQQQPTIEQQMTPAQFRAAGLEQLNAEQLANLNAWLHGTIEAEAGKAAASAKKRVEDSNRGFLNFGSSEPVVAGISGEFRGFARGRTYTLDNGQVWQQTDEATLAGVRLTNPPVKITPSLVGNSWYLQVGNYNVRAKVLRIK